MGIFNYSDDGVEKNIVVWGKVSGGTASVLTERDLATDKFNLTVWEIEPQEIGGEKHTAAARSNRQAVSDEYSKKIENNIRYIILIDPDFADKAEISGAKEGVDLKGETYYWANLGDTVTLVSKVPEYYISEAWRDKNKSRELTCDNESCTFNVPLEGGIWLNGILEKLPSTPTPTPEPTSTPAPTAEPTECPWIRCSRGLLPPTGFSSGHGIVLPEQPKDVAYKPTRMLQVPVLNIRTELVTVPLKDGMWQVDWLNDRAGVLEGSALPGEGISVVAAHNTLNNTEFGPFAMLSAAEMNDLIMVSGADGSVSIFRVYANVLLEPDDMQKLAEIAGQEENSLVLVTCENESVEGGYLNRRAVFAALK